jgi:hypothetical protein
MQGSPLLEKLDWGFTSSDWTIEFPNALLYPLVKLGLDHTPIHVQIGDDIPKSNVFWFENYKMDFDGFMEVMNDNGTVLHTRETVLKESWVNLNEPDIWFQEMEQTNFQSQ